jgi:hypothetical protein
VIVGNQQLVGDDILVDLGDDGLHVVIGLAPFGIVVGQDQPGKTHARDFEIHRGSAQQIDAGQKIDAAVAQILGRRRAPTMAVNAPRTMIAESESAPAVTMVLILKRPSMNGPDNRHDCDT